MGANADWKPDPHEQHWTIALSEDVLLGDDEDDIPAEEYSRRLKEAEREAREDLLRFLDEHDEAALREKRDHLQDREEEAGAAVSGLLEQRRSLRLVAQTALHLAAKYSTDAECGAHHFVEVGRYEVQPPTTDSPTHWHREQGALVALTSDADEVFRTPTTTTFQELRLGALRKYQRLEEPWRAKRTHAQFLQLRRCVCENILYELDHGYTPQSELRYEDPDSEQSDTLRRTLTDAQQRLAWIDDELNPKRVTEDWTWEDCFCHLRDLCDDLGIDCPYSSTDSLERAYRQWRDRGNTVSSEAE